MDEDTKAHLGQFAHELLKDERFTTFQTLYGQQMAYDMLHTQPHEAKRRESIHASYVGYGEFITVMQNFANYYVEKYTQPTQAAEHEIVED